MNIKQGLIDSLRWHFVESWWFYFVSISSCSTALQFIIKHFFNDQLLPLLESGKLFKWCLKFSNKTNNQENSAACSLALVEQTINRPEDNNNVFKTQIRCLEIMIIIVYITVYLELCNCVILINLLVYMQNNCLLFNLYYIYITFLHLIMQCFS